MPALRLTAAQAQRLWGLDADTCAGALRVLVDSGFLRRTDSGQYVRLTDGSSVVPALRMLKRELSGSVAGGRAAVQDLVRARPMARCVALPVSRCA